MRETILRDFFLGHATTLALTNDVLGSVKQVGPITSLIEIEDMDEEFGVTRAMLVSLCDAVLSGEFPPQGLSTIGFTLVASDKFVWDAEDLVGDVIHDWSCPEINYPLTLDNVQKFKNWLLQVEPYPAKPPLKSASTEGRLISRTEKKSVPRRQMDK